MSKISLPEVVLGSIVLIVADGIALAGWLLEVLNVAPGLGVSLHALLEITDSIMVDPLTWLFFFLKGGEVGGGLSDEKKEAINKVIKRVWGWLVGGQVVEALSGGFIPSRTPTFWASVYFHNRAVESHEKTLRLNQEQANVISQPPAPIELTQESVTV